MHAGACSTATSGPAFSYEQREPQPRCSTPVLVTTLASAVGGAEIVRKPNALGLKTPPQDTPERGTDPDQPQMSESES